MLPEVKVELCVYSCIPSGMNQTAAILLPVLIVATRTHGFSPQCFSLAVATNARVRNQRWNIVAKQGMVKHICYIHWRRNVQWKVYDKISITIVQSYSRNIYVCCLWHCYSCCTLVTIPQQQTCDIFWYNLQWYYYFYHTRGPYRMFWLSTSGEECSCSSNHI